MKQMSSDVGCAAATGCEGSGRSVDIKTSADSPERAAAGCERKTSSSPSRTLHFIAPQQDDCSQPVINSSPAKSAAIGGTTPKSPLSNSVGESPLPVNLRRSSRALKVKQPVKLTVASPERVTSPKCAEDAHISPIRQSPRPKPGKSSPVRIDAKSLSVQDLQSVHSSPRKTVPSSKAAVSTGLVSTRQDVPSVDDNSDKLCVIDDVDMKTPEHFTSISDKQPGNPSLLEQSGNKSGELCPAGSDQDGVSAADLADTDDVILLKIPCTPCSSPGKMDSSGQDMKFAGADCDQLHINDDVNVDGEPLGSLFKSSGHISSLSAARIDHPDTSKKTPRTRRSSPRKMDSSGHDTKFVGVDGDKFHTGDQVTVSEAPLSNSFKQSQYAAIRSAAGVADSGASEKILPTRRSRPRKMDNVVSSDPHGIRQSRASIDAQGKSLFNDEKKPLSTLSNEHLKMDGSGLDMKSVSAESPQLCDSDDVNVDHKPSSSSFEQFEQTSTLSAAGISDLNTSRKIIRTRRSSSRKTDRNEQDMKSVNVDGDQICISDDVHVNDKPLSSLFEQFQHTSTLPAAGINDRDSSRKKQRTRRSCLRKADSVFSETGGTRRSRKSVNADTGSLHMTDNEENKTSTLSKEQLKMDNNVLDVKSVDAENPQLCDIDDANVDDVPLSYLFKQSETTPTLSAADAANSDSSKKLMRTRRSSPRKMDVIEQGKSVGDDQMCISDDVTVDDKPLSSSFKQFEPTPTPSDADANAADSGSSRKIPHTRRCSLNKVDSIVASDPVGIRRRSRKSISAETQSISMTANIENKPLSTFTKEHLKMDSSGLEVKCVHGENPQLCDASTDKPLNNLFNLSEQTSALSAAVIADSGSSGKLLHTQSSSPRKMDISERDHSVDVTVDDKPLNNLFKQSAPTTAPSDLDAVNFDSSRRTLRTRHSCTRKVDSVVVTEPVGTRRSRKSINADTQSISMTANSENKPLSTFSKEHLKVDGSELEVKCVGAEKPQLCVIDDANIDKPLSNLFNPSEQTSALSAAVIADSDSSGMTLRTRRSSPRKMDISERDISVGGDQMCVGDDVNVDDKPLSSSCKQSEPTSTPSDADAANFDSLRRTLRTRHSCTRKVDSIVVTEPVGTRQSRKSINADTQSISMTANSENKPLSTFTKEHLKMDSSELEVKSVGGEDPQLCVIDDANIDKPLSYLFNPSEQTSALSAAVIADSDSSGKTLRTRRSSPRKMDTSQQDHSVDGDRACISDDVTVDDKPLHNSFKQSEPTSAPPSVGTADSDCLMKILRTRRSSTRKVDTVSSDPVGIRRSRKSVDAETESIHMTDDDENIPLSTLAKKLQTVPCDDSAAKPVKKRTVVQNRRKSSCSGRPVEKRPKSCVKSLEPRFCQKSPSAVRTDVMKSDISGIDAKVAGTSTQNLLALEDSGRRVTRPRKCVSQLTPVDKESDSIQQQDSPDLLQHDEEVASKSELGDTSGSHAVSASSDDVRIVHLCSSYV